MENLIDELKEAGASQEEAEELSLISKNVSNLYNFQRSQNLKSKFLLQTAQKVPNPRTNTLRFFLTAAFSILLLLGFASVVSAQKSLPGDMLYPVKIASEKLISSVDPSFKGEILERRSEEIKGISKYSDSRIIQTTLRNYEDTLNEDGGITQENIKNSRRNLEEASQISSEEYRNQIENAILETQEKQKELEKEVQGDSTDSNQNQNNHDSQNNQPQGEIKNLPKDH